MRNKIILFVFSVCMFSCGGGSTSKDETNKTFESDFFVFDLESSISSQGTGAVLLNSLIDSVRFIPLETIKESLFVNELYRFGVIGQNMFISGGISSNTVLQFDFEGKYIGQLAQRGQGPYELTFIAA